VLPACALVVSPRWLRLPQGRLTISSRLLARSLRFTGFGFARDLPEVARILNPWIVEVSRNGMGTSMASFVDFVMASFLLLAMLLLTMIPIDVAQSLWTPSAAIGYFAATTFPTRVCGGISLAITGSRSCICATLFARSLGLNFAKGLRALSVS